VVAPGSLFIIAPSVPFPAVPTTAPELGLTMAPDVSGTSAPEAAPPPACENAKELETANAAANAIVLSFMVRFLLLTEDNPTRLFLLDAELSHLGDGRRPARRLKARRASLMVESRRRQPPRKTRSTNGSKAAAVWEQTKSACWPNVLTHKLLPLRVAALPERSPDRTEFWSRYAHCFLHRGSAATSAPLANHRKRNLGPALHQRRCCTP
jgi:hypothetical protein